jgi:hypothetical protein
LGGEKGAEISHKKRVGEGRESEYVEIVHENIFGTG